MKFNTKNLSAQFSALFKRIVLLCWKKHAFYSQINVRICWKKYSCVVNYKTIQLFFEIEEWTDYKVDHWVSDYSN